MAALNVFGQYASPEDEYAALYGHLNNPGANNPAMFMPAFDPSMMPQGTTQVNPGAGTGPTTGMPFENMASSYPYQTVYNGPQATPQVDPATASAAPPAAPPAQQYATNMGMQGAENIGGVGMYTGANAPLDTTRFNPQSNMDFVRNIDQTTYYKYVLPFQQRGGDITNQSAVRQAIEDGMRQQGGGSYAVGSQTFNVGGAQPQQPTPNPPSQPIQYSGPTPPLPPPQQQQPPAFNPAMAYRLPQPTSPSNPFASMLQNPFQQQNPFSMGGGLGSYMGMPNMGQQQNPQLQLQQMIAMAMAQGALGQGYGMNAQPFSFPTSQGNPYMQQQPGLNRYGSPTIAGQQQTWNAQQQPSIGGYFSSDPGMMQAYYGGGSGGNQPLPQVDFRAATYGGQSQAPQAQQTPSYSQSTPQYGATQSGGASASNPWANINNTLPSLSNSYSYGWGRS